jgi:hypothetical protein
MERVLDVRACVSSTIVAIGLDVIVILSANGSIKLAVRELTTKWCKFLGSVQKGLLEVMPPAVIQTLWFRHSGTPTHHGEDYLQWLIAVYPGKWNGRGGSFELPVFSRI